MLYPVFLKLQGRPVLVVGAGSVAAAKIAGLQRCGARISVVATRLGPTVQQLAQARELTAFEREFEDDDVDGQTLVIAATNDPATNGRIRRCCERRRVLVNAVDDPEHCDFFVPAVVDRGAVQVAVSTQGASPALVRVLREQLEQVLEPSIGRFAELVSEARARIRVMFPTDFERRRSANEAVVRSGARELLARGDGSGARGLVESVLERMQKREVES